MRIGSADNLQRGDIKMSVAIIKGDLLLANETIIGHQVNCQSVMGSGVAKQIKLHFPHVYAQYKQFSLKNKGKLLGQCQIIATEPRNKVSSRYIANLFGQEFFGSDGRTYTSESALESAFGKLYVFAREGNHSVALPYLIGCDRGGGDWSVIYPMIERIFHDVPVTLYLLTK
jgi:O-acetyl-ADP-ribose deacetylase (regulator of RNase III)